MKKKIIPFGLFFLIPLVLFSCYYDNEEALYPMVPGSCDTTNVTFIGTILPILNNNCLSCHSNNTAASSGNNIRLENINDFAARSVAVAGAINHTGSFSPMPKNGGKLKACSINQIEIWIRNGMTNN